VGRLDGSTLAKAAFISRRRLSSATADWSVADQSGWFVFLNKRAGFFILTLSLTCFETGVKLIRIFYFRAEDHGTELRRG
jgi:hypothetical protein